MYVLLLIALCSYLPLQAMYLRPPNRFCKEKYMDPHYPELGLANFNEIARHEKIDLASVYFIRPVCMSLVDSESSSSDDSEIVEIFGQKKSLQKPSSRTWYELQLQCPYIHCAAIKKIRINNIIATKYAYLMLVGHIYHHMKQENHDQITLAYAHTYTNRHTLITQH